MKKPPENGSELAAVVRSPGKTPASQAAHGGSIPLTRYFSFSLVNEHEQMSADVVECSDF
jgi:hypothetical protein